MSRPCLYRYVRSENQSRGEHRVVAERALGRPLPPGAIVHHVNEDPKDNRPCNLVICESNAYHKHLHARMRLLAAGANPNTELVCSRCGQIKPKGDFQVAKARMTGHQSQCRVCSKLRKAAA